MQDNTYQGGMNMGKAEQFIREHTRGCSNIIKVNTIYGAIEDKEPWLTPDNARKAVEIAREEMYEWLKDNIDYYLYNKYGEDDEPIPTFREILFNDLKQAIKNEQGRRKIIREISKRNKVLWWNCH